MHNVNYNSLLKLTLVWAPVMFMISCANHDLGSLEVDCTSVSAVSFNDDVKPILQANCAIPGCHTGLNSPDGLGPELNWNDPEKFQDHAQEARRRVQLPKTDGDHMPRVGSLEQSEIQAIVCWVEQGADINN